MNDLFSGHFRQSLFRRVENSWGSICRFLRQNLSLHFVCIAKSLVEVAV